MRYLLISAICLLLAESAPAQTSPAAPCAGAEHRQFDFWIGTWDVFTADGKKAGENRIERMLNGCVLMENWKSASGKSVGHSFNLYTAKDKKWHQTWVDNEGLLLELVGGLDKAGRMVLAQDTVAKDQKPIRHEISWAKLEDGRVKQHWRTSRDAGKTWKDAFVGFYKKRK